MIGAWPRTPCWRSLFTELEILPAPSQHIFSFMNFTVNNQDIFKKINVYTVLIKEITPYSLTNANLQCFQKCAFYAGIKITTSSYRSQKWNGTINIIITQAVKDTLLSHWWLIFMPRWSIKLYIKAVQNLQGNNSVYFSHFVLNVCL
jgi:hypothetical protein